MTTIITRLFADKTSAVQAKERINFKGVPRRAMSVIADGDDLAGQMAAAKVHPTAIDAYARHVAQGKALLVARTTYRPLTAATIVRDLLAKMETVDAGDLIDDYFETDGPDRAPSILDEHPLFLTLRQDQTGYESAPVSVGLGIKLLSARKERTSARGTSGARSRVFWPMPLLSKRERGSSVIKGGRHMSQTFWPAPLLSTRPRQNSVIKGGDLPFSRTLSWPTIS